MPDSSTRVAISASRRWAIYAYIGVLVFVLPFTGVANTSISILLKNGLHLRAGAVAGFWFIANIPGYVGFLFGMVRDRWSPFGRRDQGILVVFMFVTVVLFLLMAAGPATFAFLLAMTLGRSMSGQMVGSAQQGLTSVLGKEYAMSGRMSALWQAAGFLPGVCVAIVAGYLADHFPFRSSFLISGFVALGIFVFSLWRPRSIYDDPAEQEPPRSDSLWQDARDVLKAPGILPCIVLLFLWNFTPGTGTPILYYLTDTLHGNATQYGVFNGIFSAFFVPTFLLHGFLCTRVPLRRILWISTVIAVPQILPLVFVHSAENAMWAGVPMGLMGGFATAAYFDLLIRACTPGLQGTAMMLGSSVWVLSAELGNVAGAKIYAVGGFPPCAYATVLVYACLLPILLFVPKRLTATRDGEPLSVAA